MRAVGVFEVSDKQSQQRREKADGRVTTDADRNAMEGNRALASQAARPAQGWSSVDRQPARVGRGIVDSAKRRSLAGFAGEISVPLDLLAARLGIARRLAKYLARLLERVKRAPAVEMERIVSGRQFRSWRKKGRRSRKNQAGQGDEVDGCRRPRCSFGKLTSLCVPGGSQTRSIGLICPHKRTRVRPATQDGRAPRRYKRGRLWSASSAGWETSAAWWSATPLAQDPWSVLSYRLLHDRLTGVPQ